MRGDADQPVICAADEQAAQIIDELPVQDSEEQFRYEPTLRGSRD